MARTQRRFIPKPTQARASYLNQQSTLVEVVNARNPRWRDVYQNLLAAPWWLDLSGVVVLYVMLNLLFGLGYWLTGGVHGTRPGSFWDAFFFSVQTLGTIGYGAFYPEGAGAHALVTAESLVGIVIVAVMTGFLFAKFSVPRARVIFTRNITIAPVDGVPTLMFRVANERGNHVVEAQIRVVLMRTERTAEGQTLYRMRDLALVRDRSPAFIRTWTVMHPITPESPLHGMTPEALRACDTEVIITLTGIDGTSSQTIHSGWDYLAEDFRFGARHADMLIDLPDGRTRLDFGQFDRLVPTEPMPGFAYPRPGDLDGALERPAP